VARANRVTYVCTECGASSARWVGRCTTCGAWSTLAEQADAPAGRGRAGAGPALAPAVPITELTAESGAHHPTGIQELDRVLGGGLVSGSAVLLAGEPGIGKSTLLLQVLARLAGAGGRVLYISAEESVQQVRLRAERLGALHPELFLSSQTDLAAIVRLVDDVNPSVLVVDSVQTVADAELPGGPGSPSQVREVSGQVVRLAKERGMATFLVGQVTKDGVVAGPKMLEHLVDVVINFEGEQHHALRMVRCVKNRYGPAFEVGCFEMTETGLAELADPSRLFLSARDAGVPGVACTISLEGRRPLVSELQALVVPTTLAMPRRTAQGLDASRLVILVAVLERRAGVGLSGRDVFAQTAGGMRVTEPAADLAICLALASAAKDRTVPADMIALGEIGLGGEIRPVPQPSRRLAEAVRLGFRRALVPPGTKVPDGITAIETASVAEAIRAIEPHGGSTSGRPRRAGSSSGATAPGVTPSVEAGGPR
jgi:DNA repair protein RadA/Sms